MLQTSLKSVVIDIRYDLQNSELLSGMLDPHEEFVVSPAYVEVWQVDGGLKKRVLYSSNMQASHLPLFSEDSAHYQESGIAFISDEDESALLSMPVTVREKHYIIVVATPIDEIDDMLEDFLTMFSLLGVIMYFSALYLGYRVIDRVLSPMQNITATPHAISQKNLAMRVPMPVVHDEFFTLSETFNTMLERIESAFEQVKRFNVNVSHELKTPLTIIYGEAEVALLKEREPKEYRAVLRSIMEESASMQQIIESMLLLSKSDITTLKQRMLPVALHTLILEVSEQKKAQAQSRMISIHTQDVKPATVFAQPELLRQAVLNLLDNAIKYTPEKQNKTVSVSLYTDKKRTVLEIVDEGVGISDLQLQHLFEPFYRVENSHAKTVPGHGLGLSIVKWITDLHNATLSIQSHTDGTTARIVFQTHKT